MALSKPPCLLYLYTVHFDSVSILSPCKAIRCFPNSHKQSFLFPFPEDHQKPQMYRSLRIRHLRTETPRLTPAYPVPRRTAFRLFHKCRILQYPECYPEGSEHIFLSIFLLFFQKREKKKCRLLSLCFRRHSF